MIRRVADALGCSVRVEVERVKRSGTHAIAERKAKYVKKKKKKTS
jgi:hypothetical protein